MPKTKNREENRDSAGKRTVLGPCNLEFPCICRRPGCHPMYAHLEPRPGSEAALNSPQVAPNGLQEASNPGPAP